MSRILHLAAIVFLAAAAHAQEKSDDLFGTVVEKGAGTPVAAASVMYKDTNGKIKKFTRTDVKGAFSLNVPASIGCTLEITAMGYSTVTLPLDSLPAPLLIHLEHGATLLNEVVVKSESIREQGDTISYTVSAFAQTQDRSIGDVLARMPGVDIDNSGKIRYQGRDINKFYIDGSDILGGKYAIATQGINHEYVGAVEVLEHHQPLQVLAGLAYSPNAAINLKLKDNAKARWVVNANAAAGWSAKPRQAALTARLYAMAIMSSVKAIVTAETNNIGNDLLSKSTDFLGTQRMAGLERYITPGIPGVPNLKKSRTCFNRSAFVSANAVRSAGKGELKVKADYYTDRTRAEASDVTTYFLEGDNTVVTENTGGTTHTNRLAAGVEYELNTRDAFLNNAISGDFGWRDTRREDAGSIPNTQHSSLPDYYVSNRFRLIKKFEGRHLVTFNSVNEWESLPQALTVEKNGVHVRQRVRDHALSTLESAAYNFTWKRVNIGAEAGLTGSFRSMRSDIPQLPEGIPGITVNAVATNSLALYVSPKIEYKLRKMLFTLNAPFNFSHHTFDKAIADRSEIFFAPSLDINWKPNNKVQCYLSASTGRSPMAPAMIHPGLIMTGYRSFSAGTDQFYTSSSQNLSVSAEYKNVGGGLFGNAYVTLSHDHLPYTAAQQLYGDYIVYSYSQAKSDGSTFSAGTRIGKNLRFLKGGASVNASFTRTASHIFSQGETVRSTGCFRSLKGTLTTKPLRWLALEFNLRLDSRSIAMNRKGAPWLSDLFFATLANIIPSKKWEWHLSGELYRNETAENIFKNVMMLDTRLIYKPSKKIEFQARLANILDRRTYSYTGYGTLCSFKNSWPLRGRELLFSISFR